MIKKQKVNLFKRYLEWAHFKIGVQRAQYKKRLFLDWLAAFTYSSVSIYCICWEQADLIVLFLNILCLLRAMISNAICATKITERVKKPTDLGGKKQEPFSHFHTKSIILSITFCFISISAVILYLENNTTTLMIKIFATLSIIFVFLNDFENILISAYDADVESN